MYIYTYVPESHEPGHAGMKPSDHVPTPEIDEIAGFKKKHVIKPTKFCPFRYAKFWYFFEGKNIMKICPINVPSLFQIHAGWAISAGCPVTAPKISGSIQGDAEQMCQKNMYISTNAKYMDTCHRYNQTSKQREEHQEYLVTSWTQGIYLLCQT